MGETLDQLHRVLTRPSMTPIERCAWNEHEIEGGECVPCNTPRCDCGLTLNPRGKCAVCDNPLASLPADDPRRFDFTSGGASYEGHPFGPPAGNHRIRSHRGPRVAAGRRG